MEEPEVTAMEAFLANATTVFTSVMEWTGTIATTVTEEPLFFVPCIIGVALVGIGVFRRLLNL